MCANKWMGEGVLPEHRRQTWAQRTKALWLAGLMALASASLWAKTSQPPMVLTLAAKDLGADCIQSIASYNGATLLATDTQAPTNSGGPTCRG